MGKEAMSSRPTQVRHGCVFDKIGLGIVLVGLGIALLASFTRLLAPSMDGPTPALVSDDQGKHTPTHTHACLYMSVRCLYAGMAEDFAAVEAFRATDPHMHADYMPDDVDGAHHYTHVHTYA